MTGGRRLEVLGPERLGQHLRHRQLPLGSEQHAYRTAVLPQELAAPPAGHEQLLVTAHADHCDEPPPAGAVEVGDHPALRAEPDSVARVLDVAPRHDPAVVAAAGRPDREPRVGRVGVLHRRDSRGLQRRPVGHVDSPLR
jgi:hypothetical protein